MSICLLYTNWLVLRDCCGAEKRAGLHASLVSTNVAASVDTCTRLLGGVVRAAWSTLGKGAIECVVSGPRHVPIRGSTSLGANRGLSAAARAPRAAHAQPNSTPTVLRLVPPALTRYHLNAATLRCTIPSLVRSRPTASTMNAKPRPSVMVRRACVLRDVLGADPWQWCFPGCARARTDLNSASLQRPGPTCPCTRTARCSVPHIPGLARRCTASPEDESQACLSACPSALAVRNVFVRPSLRHRTKQRRSCMPMSACSCRRGVARGAQSRLARGQDRSSGAPRRTLVPGCTLLRCHRPFRESCDVRVRAQPRATHAPGAETGTGVSHVFSHPRRPQFKSERPRVCRAGARRPRPPRPAAATLPPDAPQRACRRIAARRAASGHERADRGMHDVARLRAMHGREGHAPRWREARAPAAAAEAYHRGPCTHHTGVTSGALRRLFSSAARFRTPSLHAPSAKPRRVFCCAVLPSHSF